MLYQQTNDICLKLFDKNNSKANTNTTCSYQTIENVKRAAFHIFP